MNTNNKLFKLEECFFIILFVSCIGLFTLSAIESYKLSESYKATQVEMNKLASNI